jgi:hypothetical protein
VDIQAYPWQSGKARQVPEPKELYCYACGTKTVPSQSCSREYSRYCPHCECLRETAVCKGYSIAVEKSSD